VSPQRRAILDRPGAVLDEEGARIAHWGDPRAELVETFRSVVLVDRGACSRLIGRGPDLLDLLERLSTAEVARLAPGEGRTTVLTSPKGRIAERLFVHHLGAAGILLVGGPGSAPRILEHFARYTFAERTGLADATEATLQLALVGPRAASALRALGLEPPAPGGASAGRVGPVAVDVLGEDGLAADGFSIVSEADTLDAVWPELVRAVEGHGGRPAGELAAEAARVLRGIPAPGHELTDDYNPLEAGLLDAVSFSKGCYVGQEVVARLRTYDKVSRVRIGFALAEGSPIPAPGTGLLRDGRDAGTVTSAVLVPGERAPIGLAYLKRREAGETGELRLAGSLAVVRRVELPFPASAALAHG
jgi:folate-binding protein YgfZ